VRYSTSSASLTPATTPVVDDLGTYNAVGLATQYTVEVNTDTTAAYNYTNTYKYDYVGFGGSYREARQQASITLPGYTSGTTTTTFDAHGNAIQIDNPNGEPKSQRFIVDAQGRILHKDVTKKDNSVVHQDYAYVNGNPIGSNGDAESVYYDYNYAPISDQYPASNPGQYIVQSSGETLQGIAQSVFGDANLWYLIADANGLSAGATLVAGQALTIPNQVSNLHNDANTFRPYQPNEIIGDTTAAVKAPPPPSHKSNIFATILIAVVVVVVSYFAGPVLGQLVAEGLTALGASAGAAGAIGVAAGTVLGAAAGSAAGQGAGIALGVQDRFSFSAVGRAALTAAVVGGPSSGGGEATTLAGVIGEAVVSNVATQGVNIALGQQDRFSFAAVAASALAAGIEVKIGENIPGYNKITAGGLRSSGFSSPAAILGATTKNFVEGVFVRGVQSLVEKGGRINYATIAADSFGNALGNSIVGAIRSTPGEAQADPLASVDRSAVALVGPGIQVADNAYAGNRSDGSDSTQYYVSDDGQVRVFGTFIGAQPPSVPSDLVVPAGVGPNQPFTAAAGATSSTVAANADVANLNATQAGTNGGGAGVGYLYDTNGQVLGSGAGVQVTAQRPGFFSALFGDLGDGDFSAAGRLISREVASIGQSIEAALGTPDYRVSNSSYLVPGLAGRARFNLGAASTLVNTPINVLNSVVNSGLNLVGAVSAPIDRYQGELITLESSIPGGAGALLEGGTFALGAASRAIRFGRAANSSGRPLITQEQLNAELSALENSNQGAHFYQRHGAQTTLEQQQIRAATGLTPDGVNGPIVDSARFLDNGSLYEGAQRAQVIYERNGQTSVLIEFDQNIGEGYLKGGEIYARTNIAQFVFKNERLYTAYPVLYPK
jgi:LysM repeat protein